MSEDGKHSQIPESDRFQWKISRRGFLIGMAATGAALALGIPLGLPVIRREAAGLTEGDASGFGWGKLDPLIWLEIYPNGQVLLFVPKAEMGQGIHTALGQIAADELEIDMKQLTVRHASTKEADDNFRGTSGSMSVTTLYDPLRSAAATLREMLRISASKMLNQPIEKLVAINGGIEMKGDPEIRTSYGEIVSQKIEWEVPEEGVILKSRTESKYIGQSIPRVDIPSKLTGEAIFGYDARTDGMLYGAAVHRPTIEAKMVSANPGQASSMPGVVKVVIEDNFAGVVAESRSQAWSARDALEVEWEEGYLWQQEELEELVSVTTQAGVSIQREGDALSMLQGRNTIDSEYRTGMAAHAPLEPQAALADVGPDRAKVWTSTQFELSARGEVAKALDFEQDQIEIIPTYLGGGFGRKIELDRVPSPAVEAAILSRAVNNPVHVGWTRVEETRDGFFRPLTHHKLTAVLNSNGHIEVMQHKQASGDALFGGFPKMIGRILGFDFGSTRGARIFYAIPNRETTVWRHQMPIPTGAWRGLGLMANVYAIESFIDELAHASGTDPLQFRLDHLPDNTLGIRMRNVLMAAAERSNWGKRLPSDKALGIACTTDGGTVVAEIAQISLDHNSNKIRVHNVVAAVDCGRTINPDGAAAQIEGAIVMGTSAALLEEIIVKDGRVEAAYFNTYPLLKMSEAPEVETIILDTANSKPFGLGEPPIGPIAAAINNAFFNLTNKRLYRLPMTSERVKTVLGF